MDNIIICRGIEQLIATEQVKIVDYCNSEL
jgi:hypothetical protein